METLNYKELKKEFKQKQKEILRLEALNKVAKAYKISQTKRIKEQLKNQ